MEWYDRFNKSSNNNIFFVLGYGSEDLISKVMENIKESDILCFFIPDYNEYIRLEIDEKVVHDKNIYLCTKDNNYSALSDIVSSVITYLYYKNVFIEIVPGYEKKIEEYSVLSKLVSDQINFVKYSKNTELQIGKMFRYNVLKNTESIISQHSVNQIINIIKGKKNNKIPAIIVSAGPSLEKNINNLKKAEHHALIIAVDTALKAVIRHGIIPDITITIDPRKEKKLFEHEEICKIPLIADMGIVPEIVKNHKSKIFYTGNDSYKLFDFFCNSFGKEKYAKIETAGSVANNAFSFALQAGFETIILVGQDLAFTGGKVYVKDAHDDEVKNHMDAIRYGVCEVEDINGQMIKTDVQMKFYKEWFETMIKRYNNIRVIDATEGGARIEGTKIMTLEAAIDRECSEEYVDFQECIEKIDCFYSEEEQNEIKKYMSDINSHLDNVVERIENGIDAYIRLKKSVESNETDKLEDIFDEIKDVNSIEDTEKLFSIIALYASEANYNAYDSMQNDSDSEVDTLVNNAISLLKSYIGGINKMKDDLREIFH